MGQCICAWQGHDLCLWMGMKGLMSLHVAVWGKLGVVSEDGPEKDTHICLHVHVYGGQCVRARQSGVGV